MIIRVRAMRRSWRPYRWLGSMSVISPHHTTLVSTSTEDTHRIAAALAVQCGVGDCIALSGDLGTGKTTFARGFIRTLSLLEEEVVSPTFTLVQTYKASSGLPIWHFDLYRLVSPREVQAIGLEEALQTGITLIEWPQLVIEELPSHTLCVDIGFGNGSNDRHITCKSNLTKWLTPIPGICTL